MISGIYDNPYKLTQLDKNRSEWSNAEKKKKKKQNKKTSTKAKRKSFKKKSPYSTIEKLKKQIVMNKKGRFDELRKEFLLGREVSYATKKLMALADNHQHAKNIEDFDLFKQKTLMVVRKHW
jgi:hypothetical protein